MPPYGEEVAEPSYVQKRNIREQTEVTTSQTDKDQVVKYDAIIELLLAAGYFRARIPALSPFDKVIGGLTWCITSSQVDIDVDLLFQENANIGLQIKLGEAIEKSLARMRCPHPLQSHQIRGLDYINIFPVIQWLVKKVMEVRKETGDLLRMISEWQFGRSYQLPTDEDLEERKPMATEYALALAARYKPRRKLKNTDRNFKEEGDRVQATLLEYGHKAYRTIAEPPKEKKKKSTKHSQIAGKLATMMGGAEEEEAPQEENQRDVDDRRFNRMLKDMTESSDVISDNKVLGLVGMESDYISQMESELGETSSGPRGAAGQAFEESQHSKHLEHLENQIKTLIAEIQGYKGPHSELVAQLQALEEQLAERDGRNQRIVEALEKYDAMITDENRDQIETLRSLVCLNEQLKKQENQFRESCKAQLTSLKAKIVELENMDPEENVTERDLMIRDTHTQDSKRLIEHKQALGKKMRDIAMVERMIDEIPSRSELQQYQLQFQELYGQVSSKLNETRKYFQNYNTLSSTMTYLEKEISLINSIHDIFQTAMKSKSNKAKFLEQLLGILSSVNSNLSKTEQKLTDEKQMLHELSNQHMVLVERERAYHKAAKEFELECSKNEQLMEKLGH